MQLNWIKYGWGKGYSDELQPTVPLYIDFTNNGTVEYIEPLKAATDAVLDIVRNYPAPYTLMLSGGIDSQAMLWAWLQSGVTFKSLTITYNSIYNYHDIKNTISVAEKFKYKFNYHNFDVFHFLENEYTEYAHKYHCSSPHICTYMKMSEIAKDGTVIFSGNYLETPRAILNYTMLGMHRYSDGNNNRIVPYFFLHTPELAYSFLPEVEKNLKIFQSDEMFPYYQFKSTVNQNSGFPVIPQETRLSGFEVVKDYYDAPKYIQKIKPIDRLKYAKYNSKRTFDLLFRYPLLLSMGYSEDTIMKVL